MTDKKYKQKQVKISELKPSNYNPRTMPDKEMEYLKRSIEKFGFVEPMVVNKDNTIIGGLQRLKAAESLGWETVPCHYVDLNKSEEKALNLALNKIRGKWDIDLLTQALQDLKMDESIDHLLSGFSDREFEKMLIPNKKLDEKKELKCSKCGQKLDA